MIEFKRHQIPHLIASMMVVAMISITGCKSVSTCPPTLTPGSLGTTVNSSADETLPNRIENGVLLLRTSRSESNKREQIYSAEYQGLNYGVPKLVKDIGIGTFLNPTTPVFANHPPSGKQFFLFSALRSAPGRRPSMDIFISWKEQGKWTDATPLPSPINTDSWESNPTVSDDGSYFLFASDRAGGIGGSDIFICKRSGDTTWSQPATLGTPICTEFDETSPFISEVGTLFYSSKKFTAGKTFDIYRANSTPDAPTKWKNPELLPVPINSDADEFSPFAYRDSILFASNRPGGCGGFDLYGFDLCGPVQVKGKTLPEGGGGLPVKAQIELRNKQGELEETIMVSPTGEFGFTMPPQSRWELQYSSECLPDYTYTESIFSTCPLYKSDLIEVLIRVPSRVTKSKEFDFSEYSLPFFVSGYFKPNTPENLADLRKMFSEVQYGKADSVKYIQNPASVYEEYSLVVDSAIKQAVTYVEKNYSVTDECIQENVAAPQLTISVVGYADPRILSKRAKYAEESIDDAELGFSIRRGEKMDNKRLSELRAYFTAKLIQERLQELPNSDQFLKNVKWSIDGRGSDTTGTTPDELKRRVKVRIGGSDADKSAVDDQANEAEANRDPTAVSVDVPKHESTE